MPNSPDQPKNGRFVETLLKDSIFLDYYKAMILQAYAEPGYSTEEMQKQSNDDFTNSRSVECYMNVQ